MLNGKRCLIVGGTSGIGLEAACRFVDEGAKLVVAGADDGSSSNIGDLHYERCDARSEEEVDRLFAAAVKHMGGLDVLYHVAGGSGRKFGDGPLHDCTTAGWLATLELNLTTTFLTNRAAIRYFLAQEQPGVVLNMASMLAIAPVPNYFDTCAYAAAKGGVIALSRQTAARYASHGIRVNVLAPGLIDTPMSQRAVSDPEMMQYLYTKQPLAHGPGRPEDLAGAAVFLCSDAARLITGAVLPVAAGWELSDGNCKIQSPSGNA